jgi:hypothetical protein
LIPADNNNRPNKNKQNFANSYHLPLVYMVVPDCWLIQRDNNTLHRIYQKRLICLFHCSNCQPDNLNKKIDQYPVDICQLGIGLDFLFLLDRNFPVDIGSWVPADPLFDSNFQLGKSNTTIDHHLVGIPHNHIVVDHRILPDNNALGHMSLQLSANCHCNNCLLDMSYTMIGLAIVDIPHHRTRLVPRTVPDMQIPPDMHTVNLQHNSTYIHWRGTMDFHFLFWILMGNNCLPHNCIHRLDSPCLHLLDYHANW